MDGENITGLSFLIKSALLQKGKAQKRCNTLTGNGTFTVAGGITISGNVNPGGTVNPTTGAFADAAGTVTLSNTTTFAVNTQFHFELGSTTGTNDHINVGRGLNLDGTLNITALPGFGAGTYDLIDYSIPLGFTNNFLDLGTLPAGFTYSILYAPGQVDLVVTPNIPEPGTWAFVLGGVTLLLGAQRFRRNAGRGV